MNANKKPVVTIINRYYYPDRSPIAVAANDLAIYLEAEGVDVKVLCTNNRYKGVGNLGKAAGTVHQIKSFYDGDNKILKLISHFIDGVRLIRKAVKINKAEGGSVIVMSNPASLNYWAGRSFNKRKIKWMYWSMDLYPEAFVVSGLISSNNFLYKYLRRKTYANPPNALLALGRIQAEYVTQQYGSLAETIVLPCGVFLFNNASVSETKELPEWKKNNSKIILAYVGNLGVAHSEEFVKQVIDNFDPNKQTLLLRVYGLKAKKILDYAKRSGKEITILDYVQDAEMRHIDIHLVSLKPPYVNVCVPSKMVSAAYHHGMILYHGISQSDNWDLLQNASWLIDDQKNTGDQIKTFFSILDHKLLETKKEQISTLPAKLLKDTQNAYAAVLQSIKKSNL